MQLLQPHSAEEYQELFCESIGLARSERPDGAVLWKGEAGTIRHYGNLATVQSGLGDYVVPEDAVASLDYEFSFLHFGIIYQGLTYSLVDGELAPGEGPSAFVGLDESPVGAYHWQEGQHFKGTEVSVQTGYLRERLLPGLELDPESLAYLGEGAGRLTSLPAELRGVLERIEQAMLARRLTRPLQLALVMEFVALLARPDVADALRHGRAARPAPQRVRVGSRTLLITGEEFGRIEQARRAVSREANRFPTIHALAREVGLSEQKLKAGFLHQYQQTVWDYANSVRMSEAVRLLRDTDRSVADVSKATGYQSQTAFTAMFRKWTGLTPRTFRTQTRERRARRMRKG